MTTKTVDLKRFKDAVGFTMTQRAWGNRRKGNIALVKTSENPNQDKDTKERLILTKELIACKEYSAIKSYFGELQRWIYSRTVPSFFKEGFQLCNLNGVEVIEKRMSKAQVELAALVKALCNVYPSRVAESKIKLGDQYVESDYPTVETLPNYFSISHNWIAFTVPDGLPAELRQAETEKRERQFSDAAEQVILALRTGFQELIAHAADRLKTDPGQKQKTFRDSMLGNITDFIETFNTRNLTNDVELAQLVAKAKELCASVTPQKLRDYANVREATRQQFEGIKAQVDKMITETPARRFEFDDEDNTQAAA